MADTIQITVSTDWVQFPAGANFLFQNIHSNSIRVVVSATTPSPGRDGHVLLRNQSMNRIATGNHWHKTDQGHSVAEFTVND